VPKDRKFLNPLTQPSTPTETETETPTLPSTEAPTYTSTLPQVQHRKRGAQAFEKTHERITLWVDKALRARFEALAEEQGISKAQLLNEALSDLLAKHSR
jgi:hypothetical protein